MRKRILACFCPSVCLLLLFLPQALLAEGIVIPVLVGQTGASETFGSNETEGYTFAVEEWNAKGGVNGSPVSLKVEDTQTNQMQIVSAFQRLALDKPAVILGPTWLDAYQAVIPLARTQEILLVVPSSAREAFSAENKDWPISFYHNSTLEISTLASNLKQRGFSKIALLYEQEPFAEMLRNLLLSNSVSLVADFGVEADQVDYLTILTKLRAAKPDVLLIFVWNQQGLLSLLQKLRTFLPDLPLASVHDGEGWLKNPIFQSSLPQLIYSRFLVSDSGFAERFKKRFGHEPLLTASNAYDAMNSVLAAHAAGFHTAREIRKFLRTTELDTVTFGKFRFAHDGSVPSKVLIVDFPKDK